MTPVVESLLPPALRPAGTRVHRIDQGQSGASVYLVAGPAGRFVAKRTADTEPLVAWRRQVAMQRAAAEAGVAPTVVHVDEDARLVVSTEVADAGWPMYYGAPATHDAALAHLADTIRRLHDVPVPLDLPPATAGAFLRRVWRDAQAAGPLPSWIVENLTALHERPAPASDRAPVVSHNDLNPSNLRFDGARLVLLDWQTVAVNDPYYDLALVSVFQRMDAAACRRLLSRYAGAAVVTLPARFLWSRRCAAAIAGTALLWVAGERGYAGARDVTAADAPTLAEAYGAMRAGALRMDHPDGPWTLGLALHRHARPDGDELLA